MLRNTRHKTSSTFIFTFAISFSRVDYGIFDSKRCSATEKNKYIQKYQNQERTDLDETNIPIMS